MEHLAEEEGPKASRAAALQTGCRGPRATLGPSTITKVQDLGAHAQALGNASSLTLTVPNAGVAAGHSIVVELAVDQAAGTAQVSDSAATATPRTPMSSAPSAGCGRSSSPPTASTALAAGQAITVSFAGWQPRRGRQRR